MCRGTVERVTEHAAALPLDLHLERGKARNFVIAPAWAGWARSQRAKAGDDAAIEALLEYAPRYAAVAERAGVPFPSSFAPRVVGEVVGNATTDFGAPDVELPSDRPRRTAAATAHLERQVALLRASWDLLDEVAAAAPEELRKGPRGGGRDTSAVVAHVTEAERAYARQVGVRHKPYDASDHAARDAMRVDLVEAILADRRESAWVERRCLRRTAWHVLDHVWEIEDRST